MSARIRLVYPQKDDNLMMEIEQYDETADILRRVVEFWIENGDPEDYVLVKDGEIIDKEKNVDEAGIVKEDELILTDRNYAESIESYVGKDAHRLSPEILDNTIDWLEKNIGISEEDLKTIEIVEEGSKWKIVFEDLSEDNHYTVYIKERRVKRYIPSNVKDDKDI